MNKFSFLLDDTRDAILKLGIMNINDMNILKNAIKKWGHRACLHVSRLFKIFYWLCIKSLNYLHTEFNLGYLKSTKFCLESRASLIDITSIASFKPFLIAWLREYCTFLNTSSSHLSQNTPSWELFFQKNIMFYYQTFFLFKYVLH